MSGNPVRPLKLDPSNRRVERENLGEGAHGEHCNDDDEETGERIVTARRESTEAHVTTRWIPAAPAAHSRCSLSRAHLRDTHTPPLGRLLIAVSFFGSAVGSSQTVLLARLLHSPCRAIMTARILAACAMVGLATSSSCSPVSA